MTPEAIERILNPSLPQLVNKIHVINQAWKAAQNCGDIEPVAESFRDFKSRLQAQLLRQYGPENVYLQLDSETESDEPLYSVKLSEPTDGKMDAAHLPVRVAKSLLSEDELTRFVRH